MNPFSWNCPYCNHDVTITDTNILISKADMTIDSIHRKHILRVKYIVCPNPKCKEYTLICDLFEAVYMPSTGMYYMQGESIKTWNLEPASIAKRFPPYVPNHVIEDYSEACLIRDLSPKASATLSRRCLQGMIRGVWGIIKDRLIDEIKALEGKIDPKTWEAIDAVRNIGNIGAHMEKDVNTIIEIDPDEATVLIHLLEDLIYEWYIVPHERKERQDVVIKIAESKKQR